MDRVTEFMGKDHDRLDEIFKEFHSIKDSDYDKAMSLYLKFKAGLERHIAWEEEILFPLFEKRTGMHDSGPTAVMRMEHGEIKEFLEKIKNNLARENTKTEEFERGLLEILTPHNDKEENVLYPWFDNAVTQREREEIFAKIKEKEG